MTYEIKGFYKSAELDDWEDGCTGESTDYYFDYPIRAKSIAELKTRISEALDIEDDGDAIELDACDVPGRIDAQTTENEAGGQPSAGELEAWKAGEGKMFAVTYTCYVKKVSRKTVSLLEA